MDVRIEQPVTQEELEEQTRLYAIVIQACLETEDCKSFTVWSHSDRHSWIPGWKPSYGADTLFDEDHQPKPAYFSVLEAHLDQ
jgi:endo-1,4-beta-xylanase